MSTRQLSFVFCLIIGIGLILLQGQSTSTPAQPAVNQKATSNVIDASRYPNLQAALDALPATGGIVRVPPGNYELTEPLTLSAGERPSSTAVERQRI